MQTLHEQHIIPHSPGCMNRHVGVVCGDWSYCDIVVGCALKGIRSCKFYLERAPVITDSKTESAKLMWPRGGLLISVSPDRDSNVEIQSASGRPLYGWF